MFECLSGSVGRGEGGPMNLQQAHVIPRGQTLKKIFESTSDLMSRNE